MKDEKQAKSRISIRLTKKQQKELKSLLSKMDGFELAKAPYLTIGQIKRAQYLDPIREGEVAVNDGIELVIGLITGKENSVAINKIIKENAITF